MLDDAPWGWFVGELISRLPLDEAGRRTVAATFALRCSEAALRACDRAGVPYPDRFEMCVRRVGRWLEEPSEERREAMWQAYLEVNGWQDRFGSPHARTMVHSICGSGGLDFATYGAARTATDAALTLAGVARVSGQPPASARPHQVELLRAVITDALRPGWPPRGDAATAWRGVDDLVRRTWPRWLVAIGRHGEASELCGGDEIVGPAPLRRALAIADARWPGIEVAHQLHRDRLRATSDRLARRVPYEDGNYVLVDYAADVADTLAAPGYAQAAGVLDTGGALDDAVGVLLDTFRVAACVHATLRAAVADRAVAIAAEAGDAITAERVHAQLRKRW